jgi:hypothetical protein
MSMPASMRSVTLVAGDIPGRPRVAAQLYRDYPLQQLESIQEAWAKARERAATEGRAEGLAPLEHEHWDWRNKADSVEAGEHMLVAVECQGEAQGLMAVFRTPRPGRLGGGPVAYVDYVESAPWNLKGLTGDPRFLGVGTILVADAVRLSVETSLGGRVGLHSLPQAEAFYETKCRMTRVGPDPGYYDLVYFESTDQQAADWLASIGESP